MKIILLGYMGAGKSTIGKDLSTALNVRFLDLDTYISEKEQLSIPDLFKAKGEIYFRRKETEYLNEVINSKEDLIIALGGGTPCYANNMKSLTENLSVNTFYLKSSIPQLAKRLFKERNNRPLISHLSSEEDLIEFIGKHLFERSPYYSQANYTINTDNKSQRDILENILSHLI